MMRVALFVLFVALASGQIFKSNLDEHWGHFKKHHKKAYRDDNEEFRKRVVWEDNLAYIQKHNLEHDLGMHTYTLGMNEFSDMEHKEFIATMNGFNSAMALAHENVETFRAPDDFQAPSSVDWRSHGMVTGVKNQGHCGSCWAFSTTGALEGQWKKKHGQLVSLAEQQLVDCAGSEGNQGCNGGFANRAMQYISKAGGIDKEGSYRYTAKDGSCHFSKSSIGAKCSGAVSVGRSESSLGNAVASVGPISVAIDASHRSFQSYRGGVYYEPSCSSTRLDHAVLAVGYGSDHWIVKNSWGTSWGSRGYINMARNRGNNCGIASQACYPRV